MTAHVIRIAVLAATGFSLAACISYNPVTPAPNAVVVSPDQTTVAPPGSVVVKPY